MLQVNDTVEVKIGDKVHSAPVSYSVPETIDDVLGLLNTKETADRCIKDLGYATNLRERAKIRAKIQAEAGGPDKALDTLVKSIIKNAAAMGKTITPEKARAKAVAFMASED